MSAPVGHTCPKIDRVIGAIHRAQKASTDGRHEADDIIKEYFTLIDDELWKLDDLLEDLRESNQMLRGWGEESEDIRNDLEQQIVDLEEKIGDLERRLEKYELIEKDPNQQELNSLW